MDEVLPLLEKAFGKWREASGTIPRKNLASVDLADKGRVIIIDKPGSPQSLILAGHIAPLTGTPDKVIKADRLTWLIVGDREKIEAELRALELGPLTIMDADGNLVE